LNGDQAQLFTCLPENLLAGHPEGVQRSLVRELNLGTGSKHNDAYVQILNQCAETFLAEEMVVN